MSEDVRIDKWLWSARFFKTRELASKACELGRVEANGQRAKASRTVRVGDRLKVKNEAAEFAIEVVQLSTVRGPSAVAQALFRESEESQALRLKAAAERRERIDTGMMPESRPSKRERQEYARLRGRG